MNSFQALFLFTGFFFLFVTFFYLFLFLENRKTMLKDPVPKNFPKISFIIPVFNEEKSISKVIQSIKSSEYPSKPFEIIAVNDASTDNSLQVLKSIKGIKVINRAENSGKAAVAKNTGLKLAKHDFVATMDADSFAQPDALMHVMGYFEDPKVKVVTSTHLVYKPKTIWQKMQKFEYITMNFIRKSHSIIDALYVTPGPLSVFRKKDLVELGGFDEENLTEDIEMGFRMLSKNKQVRHSLNAIVYTDVPSTFKALFKQRLRWYRGGIECTKKYHYLFFNKQYSHFGMFVFPFAFVFSAFFLLIFIVNSVYNFLIKFGFNFAVGVYSSLLLNTLDLELFIEAAGPLFWVSIETVFIILMIIAVILYFFVSFKLSKDKITLKSLPFLIFFTLYWAFFMGIVWYYALFNEVFKARQKW